VKCLYPEFLIDSCEELAEASKIYIKFYDKLDEKSMTSGKSMDYDEDDDMEDDLAVDHPTLKDEKIEKMISNYYKEDGMHQYECDVEEECEDEIISKLQKNIFKNMEDIFYDVFSKVISYDPKQVVRFCRDDIFPLWFSNTGMMTLKNTKCKNCGGELIFEFQVRNIIILLYSLYLTTEHVSNNSYLWISSWMYGSFITVLIDTLIISRLRDSIIYDMIPFSIYDNILCIKQILIDHQLDILKLTKISNNFEEFSSHSYLFISNIIISLSNNKNSSIAKFFISNYILENIFIEDTE
jgi:hypothetical protein